MQPGVSARNCPSCVSWTLGRWDAGRGILAATAGEKKPTAGRPAAPGAHNTGAAEPARTP